MEAIRSLFERIKKKDNRGMSFVEVLCAVAIFALVASTVAGVVVVCARLYRSGVADTSIQQEAQFTANQVGGLIKDANRVVYNDGTGFGTDPGYLIFKTETEGYFLSHNATDQRLNYYTFTVQPDGSMPLTGPSLLSDNVSAFDMNYPDFDKTRAVDLTLTMNNGDRTYNMSYTMTARNEVVQEIGFSEVQTANIDFEQEIYLVPGETWNIPVSVSGQTGGVDIVCDTGVTVDNDHYNQGQSFTNMAIALDKAVTDDTKTVLVKSVNVVDGTTTPVVSKVLTIHVRRVNTINVTYTANCAHTSSGTYEEAGAEFTFYAEVLGHNFAKKYGKQWDEEYKEPHAVTWEASVTINGAPASFGEYFTKLSENGNATTPTVKYRLKKAMPAGMKFTVKAISLHRRGTGTTTDADGNTVTVNTNKNGAPYCDLSGNDSDIYGVKTIEPRETKLKGTSYMVLEPNETSTITTDIKSLGAVSGGIKVEVVGAKDSSTSVTYADGNLTVKIGKDETGMTQEYKKKDASGNTELVKGSGIIKAVLYPKEKTYVENMTNAAEVYIFVRRVTDITLGYKIMSNSPYTQTTPFKAGACYQFKTKVKGTNLKPLWFETNQSMDTTEYLRRFGAEFKWQFKKDGVDTDMKGTAYRLSEYDAITELKNSPEYCDGVFENEYVRISLIGVNDNQKDEPVLNLELKQDYPSDAEFEVTSTLLHPEGTYEFKGNSMQTNNSGAEYDHISAVTSLNSVLDFKQEYIVADPTQGLNTKTAGTDTGAVIDTSHMLCVPIEVKTTLKKLNVKIEGNQKPGTKVYTDLTDFKSNGTSYIYLGIDKDEPDSSDLNLIVDAIAIEDNDGDYPLATLEIPIHVRRVTDVIIKKNSGYNSKGATLKFEASADGLYGTDNFEPHRNEDKTELYPWDTKGYNGTNFVGYQTPYAFKWSMSFDGGSTWHDFVDDGSGNLVTSDSEMDQYIGSVKSSGIKQEKETPMSTTSLTTESQKSIEFKLKKKLPDNSKIKVTSLHAAGKNRGGMFYEDVYDIYTIKGVELIDCDIKRGTDSPIDLGFSDRHKEFESIASDAQQYPFFRYRELDGTWSRFYIMADSQPVASKIDYKESVLFLPDKEYEVEIIIAVVSKNQKLLLWPYDESLLESGKGWAEAGYKKGWSDDVVPTDQSEYQKNFYIGKVEVTFAENAEWGVQSGSHTFGDYGRNNPIPLKTGDEINIGYEMSYFEIEKYKNNCVGNIYKYENDKWKQVYDIDSSNSVSESGFGAYINMHIPVYEIYHISDKIQGKYRITTYIQDVVWHKIGSGSTLFEPIYEEYTETYEMYDLDTDEGVVYLKFN